MTNKENAQMAHQIASMVYEATFDTPEALGTEDQRKGFPVNGRRYNFHPAYLLACEVFKGYDAV